MGPVASQKPGLLVGNSRGADDVPVERCAAPANKVIFFVSEDWWFCLHWLKLAEQLKQRGYLISIVCNISSHRARIELAGFEVLPLPLDRSGVNVLEDLKILARLVALLRQERPTMVHCLGMKPILIGTLAARLVGGIRILNHFAGLGYLFSSSQRKARLLRPLVMLGMRLAFKGCDVHLVTMNQTDCDMLMRYKLVPSKNAHIIAGNGLDIEEYPVLPAPSGGLRTIAIVTRMIEDKGVASLVEAFRKLHRRQPDTRLLLVGRHDPHNPTAIPEEQLLAWSHEPGVTWLGHVDSIRDVWERADIAVLPSRREGLPVSLLEAAAYGRPLVATDVPGCREIVISGSTGIAVPLDDTDSLAAALEELSTSEPLRRSYGAAARELVEKRYALDVVSACMASLYGTITGIPTKSLG